jgi:hypothetical protein
VGASGKHITLGINSNYAPPVGDCQERPVCAAMNFASSSALEQFAYRTAFVDIQRVHGAGRWHRTGCLKFLGNDKKYGISAATSER